MTPSQAAANEAEILLRLHMPRTLPALREAMNDLLDGLLPEASLAVLVEDQGDGQVAVELARGAQCTLVAQTRVAANAWNLPGLQRRPLAYKGHPIGEVLVLHHEPIGNVVGLGALLDHYAAAVANLKLDTAALSMVDHYCAGLQAFEEGVILFQETDRDVTAARFLKLVASLLGANHGALLTYARVGDTASELGTDQVLGVPDSLISAMREGDDWAACQVEQAAAVHRRAGDTFPRLPVDGPAAVLQNIVSCPLRYHGISAGVALIFNVDADDPGIELKLATLRGLGELGAALLHRIQLEREAVFAKQLETQLGIAATIQARLLPSRPPSNHNWHCAWRSRPSQSIGGDYLDLFDTPDGSISAIVADVSGHGINSALLMTSARAHFRAVAGELSPASALMRLNAEVYNEVGSTGMFMTAAAMRLSADGRSLVFTSAGHNSVFLYRHAARSFEWLESSGPPLGFIAEPHYADLEVSVAPGDVIVLYSDGITEAVDAQQEEMFGEERLAAAIMRSVEREPEVILASVLQVVERFAGRSNYDDDASIVVLKV